MARIPQAEIERLKSDISLERLVEASGIELKVAGADRIGRCPFHEDREPSLVVSPRKNLWHCMGACQMGGSVIDWVMKLHGVSFRHAVELLREGVPILRQDSGQALAAGGEGSAIKRSTVRALSAPVSIEADDQVLLNQVVQYYHQSLKASPEALDYLKARGLDHPELIEHFKLGYANRTLGLRLPEKNRKAGAEIRTRLERLGIYRASGHEHFNGSLVVPVIDENGTITELYGRKIRNDLRPGTPLHLYLPGEARSSGRGVWNVAALAASTEIILCEALIDAMSFWCAGFRHVTAAYGVEGLTEDHLAAFKRFGIERVLIAYDRDEAGDRAAEKLAERLDACGIAPWRVQFPHGMDANEFAQKVTPAAKALALVLRKASWLGKPVLSNVEEGTAPVREVLDVASGQSVLQPVDESDRAESIERDASTEDESALSPRSSLAAAAKEEMPGAVTMPAAIEVPSATTRSANTPATEVKDAEVLMRFGEGEQARRYRIRGLPKNLAYEVLKVNVLVARVATEGEAFYVDTLDLYAARQRAAFVTQAAIELKVSEDIIKADLGRVLLKLEALQDEQIRKALAPQPIEVVTISEPERAAALDLLRAPDLLDRIVADLAACGIVGERTNKLVGYLAGTSRKLEAPLAVVIQSSSAAGKSSLMEAVLALMPEEERVKYSAMTGQSLFYMGAANLKHKILAIAEEEGASRASYALKLLQSEGELTIASTGKDADTGNLVTQEYRVEGPVMIMLTTTAIQMDEELLNRCLVLSIDEGREQTQAIHRFQREKRTLEGLLARNRREDIRGLHRNAQRLLRPLAVFNPYATQLAFPDQATRTRRDHEKYLSLIDTIALLHQYQRAIRATAAGDKIIEYVEVSLEDVALANAIAHEVLGRSLDELPPQTRKLLLAIDQFVAGECARQGIERQTLRFSRRQLREALSLADTQLRLHLDRLVSLEYLLVHRGARGTQFVYELLYDGAGQDGEPFVPGLIEVHTLRSSTTTSTSRGTDAQFAAHNEPLAGSSRPQRGANAAGSRRIESPEIPVATRDCGESIDEDDKTRLSNGNGAARSYAHEPVLPLAAKAAGS